MGLMKKTEHQREQKFLHHIIMLRTISLLTDGKVHVQPIREKVEYI